MRKQLFLLGLIFLLAIVLRFTYFPDNIYFGYDQARDFFVSLEALTDLKVVGPPSSFNEKLSHGPLVYYIFGPILSLFGKNPESVATFLRIYNALGIFLVFLITKTLFNSKSGLLAAYLFAVSFEQTQYALFVGHPSLAVVTVLIFYLGLSQFLFNQKPGGLVTAAFGLGMSIQSHYVHALLLFILITFVIIFHRNFQNLKLKIIVLASGVFLITLSTFVLSETKYNFKVFGFLLQEIRNFSGSSSVGLNPDYGFFILKRFIHDNFISAEGFPYVVLILLGGLLVLNFFQREMKAKVIFLLLWVSGGLMPYILIKSPSYYYAAGASVSLLMIAAVGLVKISERSLLFALILLLSITFSNLNLIISEDKKGPNQDMVIQSEMLLSDEKKLIDYIYQSARGLDFAVKALTVPLSVNTTWSYLFEWYGQQKYGYLPTWIGPTASGYPGHLVVENARSKLPQAQFLIIEPTRGIREGLIKKFMEEEGYFTKLVETKQFGKFEVQPRRAY